MYWRRERWRKQRQVRHIGSRTYPMLPEFWDVPNCVHVLPLDCDLRLQNFQDAKVYSVTSLRMRSNLPTHLLSSPAGDASCVEAVFGKVDAAQYPLNIDRNAVA